MAQQMFTQDGILDKKIDFLSLSMARRCREAHLAKM